MQKSAFSPVILIPGLGGSQLFAKSSNQTINKHLKKKFAKSSIVWVAFNEVLHPYEMSEILAPVITETFETTDIDNYDGLEIEAPKFGNVESVSSLSIHATLFTHYMHNLIEFLVKTLKYKKNVNLFAAPYDFRLISLKKYAFAYFQKLEALILSTYKKKKQRVTLISHSLGCIITAWFLTTKDQQWKNNYIYTWVTVAGPFGGSPKMLKALLYGDSLDIPGGSASANYFQKIFQTCPMTYMMLPRTINENARVILTYGTETYTTDDIGVIVSKFMVPHGEQLMRIAPLPYSFTNAGVKIVAVYGTGHNTVSTIEAQEFVIDGKHKIHHEDGDGTVPKWSLQAVTILQKWANGFSVHEIDKASHHDILYNEKFFELLMSALQIK